MLSISPKFFGLISWNANGTRGLNGNFPEQTDDFWRCSTFSVSTAGKEITVPFGQNFHFYFVVFLRHHVSSFPMRLQVWNEWEKKPFHLTKKVSEISNQKALQNSHENHSRVDSVIIALVAVLLYFIPDFLHVNWNLFQALWELRRAHASSSGFPLKHKKNPLVWADICQIFAVVVHLLP